MFTGIIEEMGVVQSLTRKGQLALLTVKAKKVLSGTKPGDSVAIDGVCLTVTKALKNTLVFDIMLESLKVTALGNLKTGERVNLERALKFGDRLGGHFVTGHVDAVLKIQKIVKTGKFIECQFAMDKAVAPYLVPKGSITVHGISLTVGRVTKTLFSVYLIPFTLKVTNLGAKKAGDFVNVETDVLAKYIFNQCRPNRVRP